jgi:hypothetical protein
MLHEKVWEFAEQFERYAKITFCLRSQSSETGAFAIATM